MQNEHLQLNCTFVKIPTFIRLVRNSTDISWYCCILTSHQYCWRIVIHICCTCSVIQGWIGLNIVDIVYYLMLLFWWWGRILAGNVFCSNPRIFCTFWDLAWPGITRSSVKHITVQRARDSLISTSLQHLSGAYN